MEACITSEKFPRLDYMMSSQQTHTFTIENKLRAFNQGNPILLEVKERKKESFVCPMTFSDITIEIKDLQVLFRLKEDYYRWLIDQGHLKTIANSILNLPWLRLKNVDFDVTQGGLFQPEHSFEELKARLLAKLTQISARDWQAQHIAWQQLPFLDIRRRYDFEELVENHQDVMKMYIDLHFTHPISDKSYYVISFPGYLEASPNQDRTNLSHIMYSSLVSKELFAQNVWGEGSYTVPDIAFVVHLNIYIPKLKRKKAFTCLIFGQDLQVLTSDGHYSSPSATSNNARQQYYIRNSHHSAGSPLASASGQPISGTTNHQSNSPSGSNNEYYVHLDVDQECSVTLFFKGNTSASNPGSLVNSGNGLSRSWRTPNMDSARVKEEINKQGVGPHSPPNLPTTDGQNEGSSRQLSNNQPAPISISSFSFTQILCELYLSTEEYRHKLSNKSEFESYGFDYSQGMPQPIQQDSFTINNTQNNYYFNGSSGYYPMISQTNHQYIDTPNLHFPPHQDHRYYDPHLAPHHRVSPNQQWQYGGHPEPLNDNHFSEGCSQGTYPNTTRADMNCEDSESQQSVPIQMIPGLVWKLGSAYHHSSDSEHHPKSEQAHEGHLFNSPDNQSQSRTTNTQHLQTLFKSNRNGLSPDNQFSAKPTFKSTSSSTNGGHHHTSNPQDGTQIIKNSMRPGLQKGHFASQQMTPSNSSNLFGVVSDGGSLSSQEGPEDEGASSQSGIRSMGKEEEHTWDEILGDPKILKKYANSKTRNASFQNLLVSLQEDQTALLLETMKPIIKDICKNKYGNYVVQLLAKSLHSNHLEAFLNIVNSGITPAETASRHNLLSFQRHFCNPRDIHLAKGQAASITNHWNAEKRLKQNPEEQRWQLCGQRDVSVVR